MISISKPAIGEDEKKEVLNVLESGNIAAGEKVREFEEKFAEYIGSTYAVATSSGTTALHTMIHALDFQPGDEIITTPFSFIATANAIRYCGLNPIFVDIEEDTFNIDTNKIEEMIKSNKKIRAILIVHLFGQACNMKELKEICDKYKLFLLEDCAQAHGSEYDGIKVGNFGHLAAFSFYATKNMTTAEGGMITGNDEGLIKKCRCFINHGMVEKYKYETLGYNYRMTNIQAAIGICQLKKLDDFNDKRIKNAMLYNSFFEKCENIIVPLIKERCKHVFHQYVIKVPEIKRDGLIEHLKKHQVQCGVFYPQPLYKYITEDIFELDVVERVSRSVVALPVHPLLNECDIEYVAKMVINYMEKEI